MVVDYWDGIPAFAGALAGALLAIPFKELSRGYFRTKGKRFATDGDIEKVLAEVRKTTEQTEAIKTQFVGGEWNRQRLMEQKRDIYQSCLEAIADSIAGHLEVGTFELIRSSGVPFDKEKFSAAYERGNAARGKLNAQAALASIYLSAEANDVMKGACAKRPVEGMSSSASESEWNSRERETLETARLRLVAAARVELGVSNT